MTLARSLANIAETYNSAANNDSVTIVSKGNTNTTIHLIGYAPRNYTLVGARTFTTPTTELGATVNVTIKINGTVVPGLSNIQANTVNTNNLSLSTSANTINVGDRVQVTLSNSALDSANSVVTTIVLVC